MGGGQIKTSEVGYIANCYRWAPDVTQEMSGEECWQIAGVDQAEGRQHVRQMRSGCLKVPVVDCQNGTSHK